MPGAATRATAAAAAAAAPSAASSAATPAAATGAATATVAAAVAAVATSASAITAIAAITAAAAAAAAAPAAVAVIAAIAAAAAVAATAVDAAAAAAAVAAAAATIATAVSRRTPFAAAPRLVSSAHMRRPRAISRVRSAARAACVRGVPPSAHRRLVRGRSFVQEGQRTPSPPLVSWCRPRCRERTTSRRAVERRRAGPGCSRVVAMHLSVDLGRRLPHMHGDQRCR